MIAETDLPDIQNRFAHADAPALLAWAAQNLRLVTVTSFQPTGIVILHLLQDIAPGLPVYTLDTGYLFPETYQLIDEIEARFRLKLTRVRPAPEVDDDPTSDQCCARRKVLPLRSAITGFEAWISGLRRDQSPGRAETPLIQWDARNGMVKLAPLALWRESDVWDYIHTHRLPYNPLHDQGYPSIGCWPCTVPAQGQDSRAGRWPGSVKTECGLHLPDTY